MEEAEVIVELVATQGVEITIVARSNGVAMPLRMEDWTSLSLNGPGKLLRVAPVLVGRCTAAAASTVRILLSEPGEYELEAPERLGVISPRMIKVGEDNAPVELSLSGDGGY